MKYAPKKVFILEDGEYIELSYQEFCAHSESEVTYSNKYFIPLHGMLMEVDKDAYRDFYKSRRRQKYLEERSEANEDFSYDMLTTDDFNGEAILVDENADVAEMVVRKIMLDKLRQTVLTLSDEEQLLIYRHYYAEISETELASLYGILQQAVSKRIGKIRAKLKKFLEN